MGLEYIKEVLNLCHVEPFNKFSANLHFSMLIQLIFTATSISQICETLKRQLKRDFRLFKINC